MERGRGKKQSLQHFSPNHHFSLFKQGVADDLLLSFLSGEGSWMLSSHILFTLAIKAEWWLSLSSSPCLPTSYSGSSVLIHLASRVNSAMFITTSNRECLSRTGAPLSIQVRPWCSAPLTRSLRLPLSFLAYLHWYAWVANMKLI